MRFIEDPKPPIAALKGLTIVIAGSLGAIRYQVDGFAPLG